MRSLNLRKSKQIRDNYAYFSSSSPSLSQFYGIIFQFISVSGYKIQELPSPYYLICLYDYNPSSDQSHLC